MWSKQNRSWTRKGHIVWKHKQLIIVANFEAFSRLFFLPLSIVLRLCVCVHTISCLSLKWLLIKSFLSVLSHLVIFSLLFTVSQPLLFCRWCFPALLAALMVFSLSLHCTHLLLLPPPICSLLDRKAILVVDWRMMLLLRESLHQHRGRRARGEREREKLRRSSDSPGRYSCDGWAVKRPIVQITRQAPCHHPGLIYGAVQCGTDIALWVESAGDAS